MALLLRDMSVMQALQYHFTEEPDCAELRQIAEGHRNALASGLTEEQRKILLRLEDTLSDMQDVISLASFTAGFELACRIAIELTNDKEDTK